MERKFDGIKQEIDISKKTKLQSKPKTKLDMKNVQSRFKSEESDNPYAGMNSALLTQYSKIANEFTSTVDKFSVENEVFNVREDL